MCRRRGGGLGSSVHRVVERGVVGAAVVSVLKLPLSSIVIALLVTQAGPTMAPLVIVGVVVASIAIQTLSERGGAVAVTSVARTLVATRQGNPP